MSSLANLRCHVEPGQGFIYRWSAGLFLIVAPEKDLTQLIGDAEVLHQDLLLKNARGVDWGTTRGGYGALLQQGNQLEVETAGEIECRGETDTGLWETVPSLPIDQLPRAVGLSPKGAQTPVLGTGLLRFADLNSGATIGGGVFLVGPERSDAVPSTDQEFEIFDIDQAPSRTRSALPLGSTDTPTRDIGDLVTGRECRQGHFNDPDAPNCFICGIAMHHLTYRPRQGPRPALGYIQFETQRYSLARNYRIGRSQSKTATDETSIILDSDTVSRNHALVTLQEWEVLLTDLDSTNGTYVKPRNSAEWKRIKPYTPVGLKPGTDIKLGEIEFSFHSIHRPA